MVTYAARYDDIPKVVNISGRFWCNTGKSGTPSAVAWAASMKTASKVSRSLLATVA